MSSQTIFVATLSCIVLLMSEVYCGRQNVDPNNVKVIDAVVRGEIATLIIQDYNTALKNYEQQNANCAKSLESLNLESKCSACAKKPDWKDILKHYVKKIATKAIEGVKKLGKKAGKFAKKLGKKVIDKAQKALENVEKIFKHLDKGVGKALEGAKNVIKGIGKTFRRIVRRVRLPRVRLPRVRVPRVRVRRVRVPRVRVPRVRVPRVRVPVPRVRIRRPRIRVRRWGRRRRRFGKKRSELTIKQIDDIINEELHVEREKRDSTCHMCDMDENALVKQICGDMSAAEKRVEDELSNLQKAQDFIENSEVLQSVSYDTTSKVQIIGQTPTYSSVNVRVEIGYFWSSYRTAASFGYDNETVIESMGAVVASETYNKYKKSCEWTI
ncbi:hypothetical protein FSP39_005781 [Pinctada imbricata]|uniref:Uncharacterized protein n=1 Tax=Pinctada imbricata TaxID=66713 RepID=A0AA89BWW9_PINIB|nr:hypothetical protein FSP39_005781 [Pinctada imbricata]